MPLDVVEKNNTRDVSVTVTNNASGSTIFSLRTVAGTGSATFADGSTSITINGNVTNQTLTIKGVTESSQADNITIEAKFNNSPTVSAHDEFTVATITSLVFQEFDTDYTAIDDNPGNGQPNTRQGQRIFPDIKDVNDINSGKDRSLVKVNATVSPAVPNLKVYFGSYDLDDPSADAAPLDSSSGGNDNNGNVNGSKSGDFTVLAGNTCVNASTGAFINYISTIECPTLSDGTTTAQYKITMQPGDNIAVAASLQNTYRDEIRFNISDGTKLINSANQTIPISGEANTDNAAGIRTKMLTVWRSLHIEVDSMADVTNNHVTGTFPTTQKPSGSYPTYTVSPQLPEIDRFENGRLVIGSNSYSVISNTNNTVTIINNSGLPLGIRAGTSFTLYDDDDFNDNDGTTARPLHGDEGENVDEPDLGLLTPNEVSCSNAFNTNNCNVLVSAYVRPTYDLSISHEDTTFYANASDTAIASIRRTSQNCNFFQNCNLEASTDFWTIYLLGAYQYITPEDGDPDSEGPTLGLTDGIAANDGEGSVIFNEVNRPHEYDAINVLNPTIADWRTRPVNRRFTVAHEVGHLFGGVHGDFTNGTTNAGLMAQSFNRSDPLFTDTTINKIRGGTMLYHP